MFGWDSSASRVASLLALKNVFKRFAGSRGAVVVEWVELIACMFWFWLDRYVTCQRAVGVLDTRFRLTPFLVKRRQRRGSRPSTLRTTFRWLAPRNCPKRISSLFRHKMWTAQSQSLYPDGKDGRKRCLLLRRLTSRRALGGSLDVSTCLTMHACGGFETRAQFKR